MKPYMTDLGGSLGACILFAASLPDAKAKLANYLNAKAPRYYLSEEEITEAQNHLEEMDTDGVTWIDYRLGCE